MSLLQESDVGKVLADQGFMEHIVSGLVRDSSTMDKLADDIADKVQDALVSQSDLRERLVTAAISNEAFKQKVVAKLIDELS